MALLVGKGLSNFLFQSKVFDFLNMDFNLVREHHSVFLYWFRLSFSKKNKTKKTKQKNKSKAKISSKQRKGKKKVEKMQSDFSD